MTISRLVKRMLRVCGYAGVVPVAIPYFRSDHRSEVEADIEKWGGIVFDEKPKSDFSALLKLLNDYKEFRNLYYFRVPKARWFSLFCREEPTLHLQTPEIGGGLFIQHGFATIINAEKIGRDCWINQQVTVGHSGKGRRPVIGDGVKIRAGAKVIGKITVGDDVAIGANAVVVKDVPPHCTVAGVPAKIVRQDGVRVDKPL
ncbi:serine acetyltransferase [Rhizobium sp. BK418]|uniref:serine O-acetyltransferase n=1 Tax=Rhizobium sp. BK418 TaxID=2512120 RepID=UPI0010D9E0CA|nr:serine acetyltransferase [Rhizobium sp. BK418]TCS05358.1 serine O-acetyltransferase [Rhizobium sp. BK418]